MLTHPTLSSPPTLLLYTCTAPAPTSQPQTVEDWFKKKKKRGTKYCEYDSFHRVYLREDYEQVLLRVDRATMERCFFVQLTVDGFEGSLPDMFDTTPRTLGLHFADAPNSRDVMLVEAQAELPSGDAAASMYAKGSGGRTRGYLRSFKPVFDSLRPDDKGGGGGGGYGGFGGGFDGYPDDDEDDEDDDEDEEDEDEDGDGKGEGEGEGEGKGGGGDGAKDTEDAAACDSPSTSSDTGGKDAAKDGAEGGKSENGKETENEKGDEEEE